MTQRKRIRYIINPEDDSAMEQFIDRLQFLGMQTIKMKSFDKYRCFESTWDDTENPEKGLAFLSQSLFLTSYALKYYFTFFMEIPIFQMPFNSPANCRL